MIQNLFILLYVLTGLGFTLAIFSSSKKDFDKQEKDFIKKMKNKNLGRFYFFFLYTFAMLMVTLFWTGFVVYLILSKNARGKLQ